MAKLTNNENNLCFELTPILKDDFGFLCQIHLSTELINITYDHASNHDKYISHNNLAYLKDNITNLERLDDFAEESELIFDIYPIDMFMMLDVYKSNNTILWIELKMPTGIFSNGQVKGYFIAFNFWTALHTFKHFIHDFIQECEHLS